MLRNIMIVAALAATAPAFAEDAAPAAGGPPKRIASLVVYGDDPCPKGRDDEVVVCARRPESERYRLPKRFRETPPGVAQGSWTNRAEMLDAASRQQLPNSCSPVGSNGQSGCYSKFLAEARASRREDAREAAATP